MDAICTAALAKFREQEANFRALIAGLSDQALNWRPGPETNSLAVLAAHTWGSAQEHTARASGRESDWTYGSPTRSPEYTRRR